MNLTYISTYPPRECGLASFNKNIIHAINSNTRSMQLAENNNSVVAIDAGKEKVCRYPEEVKFIIKQYSQEDYSRAADFINSSDADCCILQHEFGIYGGDNGVYVLSLVNQLEKPLIAIFHTVLRKPSYQQKIILQSIAHRADRIVVMGKIAVNLLREIYDIPVAKICYVQHGAPDIDTPVENPFKTDPLFKNRRVLLTFGLISRNKGLETVIKALPNIVKKHPDILYVILGTTHPDILKSSGEEYREYLIQLAKELKVNDHLVFINRYVTEEELINYLSSADIYVSPYLNEAQITSGTLAYAIGAGAAVVATPYWHATEILSDGRGRLFDFKDDSGLTMVINGLLDNPDKLRSIRENAYAYGLNLRWPVIGKQYVNIIKNAVECPDISQRIFNSFIDPEIMPEFDLSYIKQLTDHTGVIQHAKYGIPNWKEGYCVDDNSRALIMSLMAIELGYKEAFELVPVYMSFLLYMQNDNGYFRNFLSYQKEYLDEKGSEDAFGRAIWALGYLIGHAPEGSYSKLGVELFHRAYPNFKDLVHLRGAANAIIGISYYLKVCPSDYATWDVLDHLTSMLMNAFKMLQGKNWQWFEDCLTYDNAILPLALFHSAEVTRDQNVMKIALESMNFLEKATLNSKCFNPVGNNGWYTRDGKMPSYDQQAIDSMAMVLMYTQVYRMTNDRQYLEKLFAVYAWFLGRNSLCMPVYNSETKGCYDGLHPQGINQNQGAESTLAYLIAHLSVLEAFKVNPANAPKPVNIKEALV